MPAYIDILREELADAQHRLQSSEEPEGKKVIQYQIQEINRDILRLSEYMGD